MDLELVFWMAVFVGGYLAVVAYLFRIALRKGGGGEA